MARAVGLFANPGEQTHRVIADRVFTALGPVGGPVRAVHDAIASASYASVRGTAVLVGEVVAAAAALPVGERAPRLDASVRGSGVVAAVNGLLGDRLAADGNDLDLGMTLRRDGRDLSTEPDSLRAAYPEASPHLVLLVPGLGETEHAWRYRRSGVAVADEDYGQRLAAELGVTPLYLRYNTGQPLATSAVALSALLERVVGQWPVPVRRIDLIGHSMGGLVARLACALGAADEARWTGLVRHVVYLGSPHGGAALARGAALLAGLLSARPMSRGWGELLDVRSAGIQDLSAGVASAGAVPLPSAEHHTVVAELAGSEKHLVSYLLGDLMVRSASAEVGVGDRLRIAPAHHLDLLNHPLVHQALRRWLG